MNNDGYDDLLIGGPEEDSGANDAGAAWLFFGPVSTSVSVTAADATFKARTTTTMSAVRSPARAT